MSCNQLKYIIMESRLREKYNALDLEISNHFSDLLKMKDEFVFLTEDEIEDGDCDDFFEYRNDVTGNVIDVHIIKVNQDGIFAVECEDTTQRHTLKFSNLADMLDKINLCMLMKLHSNE